jgi:hypothetical protein
MEWELAGETQVPGENPPQWRFLHHKSHMSWLGTELGPPRWEAGYNPPELLVYRDVIPYSLTDINQRFRRTCCFLLQETTHLYNAEARNLQSLWGDRNFHTSHEVRWLVMMVKEWKPFPETSLLGSRAVGHIELFCCIFYTEYWAIGAAWNLNLKCGSISLSQ